jgi:hypothetical protein
MTEDEKRQAAVVEYLCSAECLPRDAGNSGARNAGRFLAEQLDDIGLEPAGTAGGYLQEIPSIGASNVLGAMPGRSDRWLVLGAHYDACSPNVPGADDNAAGVAVVLEVARRLQSIPLEHSVLFALFDAEEPPNFLTPEMGSQWFVDHPTIPLGQTDTMVCLDLVGHALGPTMLPAGIRDSVFVLGAEKGSDTPTVFDGLPATLGIVPRRIDDYVIPALSDYHAFNQAAIPFLFYSCGRSEHYHASTDTPDRLDYAKMSALARHLTGVITALGRRSDRPRFLPDGVDDHATVGTLEDLLAELAPYVDGVGWVRSLVEPMRERLERGESLRIQDRQAIASMVVTIEDSLAWRA